MKALYLLAFFLPAVHSVYAQGTWTQKASLPSGRAVSAGFSIDGKGYISTGMNLTPGPPWRKDLLEYDTAANTWTQKADYPGEGRHSAAAFTLNQKGFVGGGTFLGGISPEFYRYDPATDSWTPIADRPGQGASFAAAFTTGSRAYVGLGFTTGSTYLKTFYEYNDSTNAWARKADFPGTAGGKAGAFTANGKGYVVCGLNSPGTGSTYSKQVWEYDPATNAWTRKADFPGDARNTPVVLNLEGRILVGMGDAMPGVPGFSDMYEYLPATDTWTPVTPFPGEGRSRAAAFSIGRRGYVGTGLNSSNQGISDWWEFSFQPLAVSPKQSTGFLVWPNPASGQVRFTPALKEGAALYSPLGQAVISIPAGAGSADLSSLPRGLYWLRSGAGMQRLALE